MYYLPFDRLMGLWIINEFLKTTVTQPENTPTRYKYRRRLSLSISVAFQLNPRYINNKVDIEMTLNFTRYCKKMKILVYFCIALFSRSDKWKDFE